MPHAVARLLPCRSAWLKTSSEQPAATASAKRNAPGVSSVNHCYSSAERKSSIDIAVTVWIRALPRAPSATETFAIVFSSGASTTFTKSNGPSVAHWCSTFAPSSSTSRLTSRSRSGFDFSVCTPWAVRLVSMM